MWSPVYWWHYLWHYVFSLCGHPIMLRCSYLCDLGFILMAFLQPYLIIL